LGRGTDAFVVSSVIRYAGLFGTGREGGPNRYYYCTGPRIMGAYYADETILPFLTTSCVRTFSIVL
jgi:hypothetical protein